MKATMVKQQQFDVRSNMVSVIVDLDEDGIATRLLHGFGKRPFQEFRGDEITTTPSDEGIRATVLLQNGAGDGPIVRFSVILPEVVPGDESTFEVTAAAVQSTEPSGFGGPQPGPRQSYEAMVLEGKVTLSDDCDEVGTCHDWQAIHDLMPGHPAKLTVTGTCTFPTPGYEVQLRPSVPQGINPRDLLLDKIVTPPTGIVPQVVTDVEVRYEDITDVMYETVTIEGGPSIKVENAL